MKTYTYQKGVAILIVVLFFVILSATLLVGVSMPIAQQIRNANEFLTSKKSYTAADAQAENTLYRLNKGKTDSPADLTLLGAVATGVISDVGNDKRISIQSTLGQFQRFIQAQFRRDAGVSFNYGLQTGTGGLQMSGSSYIVGNVYSNGDIVGGGGAGWYNSYITGSAISATISNPTPHISNLTSTTTASTTQNVGVSNTNQDFAQSFVMGTTSPVVEVDVYLKKTGAPANAIVKIVNNSAGSPGSTVITSGTLNSALATSLYSYVPITMTTNVAFASGTTYWMIIDMPSNSATNYYTLGLNNNGYTGTAKQGISGSSWTNLASTTLDAGFKVLVGGDPGVISGIGVGTSGTGDAWAKTVTNTTVTGALYCQIGTGNNKACDISRADPTASPMPVSDGVIDQWKADALAGGSTTTINLSNVDVRVMGPMKINGNLTLANSAILRITGPIYVTGNVSVSGSAKIYVDSSMGSASGVIVADGRIDISASGGIYGSGSPGSYVVVSTPSTCPIGSTCGGLPAISVSGAAGSIVLNAPNGTINFSGSSGVKAVVAKTMIMSGATYITYDSGLASLSFTSGPSGSWTVGSWKEALGL